MCDKQHNNGISLEGRSHQLIDLSEIKQEPDIMEEPKPVVNLIEDDTGSHPLANYSRFGIENDSKDQTINEIKIEVLRLMTKCIRRMKKSQNQTIQMAIEWINNVNSHRDCTMHRIHNQIEMIKLHAMQEN